MTLIKKMLIQASLSLVRLYKSSLIRELDINLLSSVWRRFLDVIASFVAVALCITLHLLVCPSVFVSISPSTGHLANSGFTNDQDTKC